MRIRAIAILVLSISLLRVEGVEAGLPVACWSISTDESSFCGGNSTSEPWSGDRILYLRTLTNFSQERAEFDLTGTLEIVSFLPRAGWTNEGTATSLVLRRDPCGDPEELETVGELVVRDGSGSGGNLCFATSTETGMLCASGCGSGFWVPISYIGFSSDGSEQCSGFGNDACDVLSVEPNSWGRVKTFYR